jgi:hypothetical protein
MNVRRTLLGLTFAAVVAEGTYALFAVGLGGTIEAMGANPITRYVAAEVVLCLVMLCVWMARDARQRGINVWPFIAATVVLGGPGPLLYFVMHPQAAEDAEHAAGAVAVPASQLA